MKHFLSCLLAISLFLSLSINSFAATEDNYITLAGENGSFSFNFEHESNSILRSSSDVSYEYYGDHVKINVPLSDSSIEEIYTELELPEGAYLKSFSSELYEKEVFLIENIDGVLLGLVDIPIITLSDGTEVYGENTTLNNTVFHSYDEAIASDVASMSVSVYVTRPWSYYFYDMGYNGPEASQHDFCFNPKGYIIISEKEGFGTYIISWNARDSGFRSGEKALSSGDLNLWNSYLQSLEWQYRCHYDYVATTTIWNIEPKGNPTSYDQVVLSRCNL